MVNPDHTETITNEILADLSLREKNIIAHMDNLSIEILQAILERHAESKGYWIEDGRNVVKSIWAKLYESHRLRAVE